MQRVEQQRIADHRQRSEQADARDRIADVLIPRSGDGIGRNDRGGAANGCSGSDEFRERSLDAENATYQFGEEKGCDQNSDDNDQRARAQIGKLINGQL